PLFHTLQEALDSGLPKIGFRELGKAGGGAWELAYRAGLAYGTPLPSITEVHQAWSQAGRRFIMDGSVPNDKSTMQGEVCRTEKGLESFLCVRDQIIRDQSIWNASASPSLNFRFKPGLPPMRQTIAANLHRHRGYLETRLLLERYMDPSSRDDLDALLDLYPDASIEFTCFSVNTGVI